MIERVVETSRVPCEHRRVAELYEVFSFIPVHTDARADQALLEQDASTLGAWVG